MTGHNPTDRSKLGSKRHILTDKNDIPLSTFITSANTMMLRLPRIQLTILLLNYHQHHQNRSINRIYVLIKHIFPKK